MTTGTYDELIRRTPEWLYATNRAMVDEMESLVQQAHDQVINLLDHDLFRTVITGKTLLASDKGLLDLSSEDPPILELRGISLQYRGEDDFTPIFRRDLEMLKMLYARNRPARPLYYAEYSGPLVQKLYPMPNEDILLEITANVEPPVLSPSNQTNIISEKAFRVIEKATFRQACLFMKNWEDAAAYEKEMVAAINEANAQIQRRRRDESEKRPDDASNVMGV